jgi:hypothetical protein
MAGLTMWVVSSASRAEPDGDCPALLTKQECGAYHAQREHARSHEERVILEKQYAAMLKERARLCPTESRTPRGLIRHQKPLLQGSGRNTWM